MRLSAPLALALALVLLPLAASAYPVKVWVRNCCDAKATVTLGKQTFEFKEKDFGTIELKAPGEYTFTVTRAGKTETVTRKLKDYYSEVTLLDLGRDAAYALVDVGSYYRSDAKLTVLPLVHTAPPALVHTFAFPFGHLLSPVAPLPESFHITLSGGHLYKVKAVPPESLKMDRKKLAAGLTVSILKKELARETAKEAGAK